MFIQEMLLLEECIFLIYLGQAYFGCRGFFCDDRTRCLSQSSVCDGYTSCSDGSDEANCCT